MNNNFYYAGNAEELIKEFGFHKLPDTEEVEFVYEVYQLPLKDVGFALEMTIEKHPEEDDKVYIEFCDESQTIRLNVRTKEHLKYFIETLTNCKEL